MITDNLYWKLLATPSKNTNASTSQISSWGQLNSLSHSVKLLAKVMQFLSLEERFKYYWKPRFEIHKSVNDTINCFSGRSCKRTWRVKVQQKNNSLGSKLINKLYVCKDFPCMNLNVLSKSWFLYCKELRAEITLRKLNENCSVDKPRTAEEPLTSLR